VHPGPETGVGEEGEVGGQHHQFGVKVFVVVGELADAVGEGGGAPGEGGHEFVVGVCEAGGVVDPRAVEASALRISIPDSGINGGRGLEETYDRSL